MQPENGQMTKACAGQKINSSGSTVVEGNNYWMGVLFAKQLEASPSVE